MKYLILATVLIPTLSFAGVSETFEQRPECRVSGTAAICLLFNGREDANLICRGKIEALTQDGKKISNTANNSAGPYGYQHFIIENAKDVPLVAAKAELNCFYRQN